MDEIRDIIAKYDHDYLVQLYGSLEKTDELVSVYYEDVAEILDVITRLRNSERNPTGFSSDDAPILGLLIRLWKLLKLTMWIYEEDSAEFAPVAERSLIEVAVTATYLLNADRSVIEDYRRCSFKNRLRILEEKASESEYFKSKAGKRIVRSIMQKLALEGLNESSFVAQIKNRWRVQGKTFYDMFRDVMDAEMYAMTYGVSSESVHASWQDVMGYSLDEVQPRKFLPLYRTLRVSIGHISLVMPFAIMPYRQWTKRIEIDDPYICEVMDYIEKLNNLFLLKHYSLFYGE